MTYPSENQLRQFNVAAAQQYAREGKIEEWVHIYLNADDWANVPFSEGLKLQQRWWNGPVEMPLSELVRAVGIEANREYCVPESYWSERTTTLAETLTDPLAVPPLIVEYRQGELSVRDGNTRLGAMESLGWSSFWVIIWYNSKADFQKHSAELYKHIME